MSGRTDAGFPAVPRPGLRRRRIIVGIAGGTSLLLAVVLGALAVSFYQGRPLNADIAWLNAMLAIRNPVLDVVSFGLNIFGGGILGILIVPLTILVVLLLMQRPWGASYFLAASLLGASLVQLLKHSFGRARPEEILVNTDFGSYPSGHVTNAMIMVVALGLIFPRLWVWLAGAAYVLAMMFSRTYLGAHWLTDTIGGVLAGFGLAALVWLPLAGRLEAEERAAIERKD